MRCLVCALSDHWEASFIPDSKNQQSRLSFGIYKHLTREKGKPSGPSKYQDLSDSTVSEKLEFMEELCDTYFKVRFPIFKFGILPDGNEPATYKARSCFHFPVGE